MKQEGIFMLDVLFVAVTLSFFALSVGYVVSVRPVAALSRGEREGARRNEK